MILSILHLSDIHIKTPHDAVIPKAKKIATTFHSESKTSDIAIIAITGDIAFSGTKDQYDISLKFIKEISNPVAADKELHIIATPGNHDCDFKKSNKNRELILKGLRTDPTQIDDSVITACTSIQDDFFEFLNNLTGKDKQDGTRLCYTLPIPHKDESILIQCCNTAWCSQLNEAPGASVFPPEQLASSSASLAITLFHHPLNWLTPINSRAFRKQIEKTSDIILTGHEHDFSARTQSTDTGATSLFIEGCALQESNNKDKSEFNIITIDTNDSTYTATNYRWQNGEYKPGSNSRIRTPYSTNKTRKRGGFDICPEFHTQLNDLGVTLNHPKVEGNLTLGHVFIYPDIKEVTGMPLEFGTPLEGERLSELVLEDKKILITGVEKSGKTCLAKKIFLDLTAKGLVPLFLDASDLNLRGNPRDGDRILSLFTDQYSPDKFEEYRQLELDKRAIIIDNFHDLGEKKVPFQKILKTIGELFSHVIFFSNDMAQQVHQLMNAEEVLDGLSNFKHYRIQQFGHVKRNELAEKWIRLGGDQTLGSTQLARRLHEIKKITDNFIGKNFVPAFPVFILPVLQAQEHSQQINLNASTYGYFYELLIRQALAQNASREDFDVKLAYLSFLAFAMFDRNISQPTEKNLRDFHGEYELRHAINLNFSNMLSELIASQIICKSGETYVFKYGYIYYYFVASFMRDAIMDPAQEQHIKSHLDRLCAEIDKESNANILLFLVHLSKHPYIIGRMLQSATTIFPEHASADLAPGPLLSGDGVSENAEFIYEEKPSNQARKEYLQQLDEVDSAPPPSVESQKKEELDAAFAEVHETIRKYSIAFKTLQILGQTAKNFPGSLKGEQKRKILDACYGIGLRTLSVFVAHVSEARPEFLRFFEETLREERPELAPPDLTRLATESIYGLLHFMTLGAIKQVARAVGAPALTSVNKAIKDHNETPATDLIYVSTLLDQSSQPFPVDEVEKMGAALRKNPFSSRILQSLVVSHFHLFDEDFAIKQRVCQKLGISYKPLQRLNPRTRLLSGGTTPNGRRE